MQSLNRNKNYTEKERKNHLGITAQNSEFKKNIKLAQVMQPPHTATGRCVISA